MVPEILELVLMPFDFFLDLVNLNPYFFVDASIVLVVINAVYRFLLAPIVGGGSGSSDFVKKEKKKN